MQSYYPSPLRLRGRLAYNITVDTLCITSHKAHFSDELDKICTSTNQKSVNNIHTVYLESMFKNN